MGEGYRATDTMRRLFGCVIMATLMLACSSPPERPRKVGRVERSYADASRPNWTGDGPRPLLSMIWFPTDSDSTEERWPVGNRFLPLFWAGWSIPDAELSKRESRYPLVVLSHGTGGATAQVSWLAESLASHGYIVAAVNHHGNNAIDEETPHGFFLWWERADDLRVLIDRVLEDPMFDDRVDRLRIGAAGFSLGGYTVLEVAGARTDLDQMERFCDGRDADPSCKLPPEAPLSMETLVQHIETDPRFRESMDRHRVSYADPRVRSIVAMAPAAGMSLTEVSLTSVSVPVLIIVGDQDSTAPPESNAERVAALLPDASLHVLPGVKHYAFLAQCGLLGRVAASFICADANGTTRGVIHDNVAALAVEFFNRTLSSGGQH